VSEDLDMSTTDAHNDAQSDAHNDAVAHEAHEAHEDGHEHRSDMYYVKVAIFLAIITALETSTYWIDFGPFFLPVLLILMAIKFVVVASVFMHLKFDSKIFSWLFYSGLLLAIGVYAAFLATFRFFTPT
jgi:cytochrome c oxidase subunit 4